MTKVQGLVMAVVASGLADEAYKRIVAAIEYDECPCCFESAYPGLDDDAALQGEVEAAIICSQPVSPLWSRVALPVSPGLSQLLAA